MRQSFDYIKNNTIVADIFDHSDGMKPNPTRIDLSAIEQVCPVRDAPHEWVVYTKNLATFYIMTEEVGKWVNEKWNAWRDKKWQKRNAQVAKSYQGT